MIRVYLIQVHTLGETTHIQHHSKLVWYQKKDERNLNIKLGILQHHKTAVTDTREGRDVDIGTLSFVIVHRNNRCKSRIIRFQNLRLSGKWFI